jgi:hypothetical protein
MPSRVRASLVIPTLNAGPLLEEVLEAVDRQPGVLDLEKMAMDSGSSAIVTRAIQPRPTRRSCGRTWNRSWPSANTS